MKEKLQFLNAVEEKETRRSESRSSKKKDTNISKEDGERQTKDTGGEGASKYEQAATQKKTQEDAAASQGTSGGARKDGSNQDKPSNANNKRASLDKLPQGLCRLDGSARWLTLFAKQSHKSRIHPVWDTNRQRETGNRQREIESERERERERNRQRQTKLN